MFKNLPVRRQFYNTNKKKKDELKRIEDLLISYGIISPSVRISLRHNKETVWQKNPVPDVKTAILETLGKSISCCLQKKELSLETPKVRISNTKQMKNIALYSHYVVNLKRGQT